MTELLHKTVINSYSNCILDDNQYLAMSLTIPLNLLHSESFHRFALHSYPSIQRFKIVQKKKKKEATFNYFFQETVKMTELITGFQF